MAKYDYSCPKCGTTLELRKRVTLNQRTCPHCGTPITVAEIDRQKRQATLFGCAGVSLLILFCCVLPGFFRKESTPPSKPVAVTSPQSIPMAPPQVVPTPSAPQLPETPAESAPAPAAVALSPPAQPIAVEKDEVVVAKIPVINERIPGKVISITDGDTLKLLKRDHEQLTVRLEGIDAPEAKQQHGSKAKEALSKLVLGKDVTLGVTGTDKYGRTLGIVLLDGNDINVRMLEDGWAWHYKKYNSEPKYGNAELRAKTAKLGLWSGENFIPPWEFRDRQKLAPESAPAAPRPPPTSKRTAEPAPLMKQAFVPETMPVPAANGFWLNTGTGVRHNASCQHFANTKRGRFCGPAEGRACGICGG